MANTHGGATRSETLHARCLTIPAAPLAIAQAFVTAKLSGVALLHSGESTSGPRCSFVAALPDRSCSDLHPPQERSGIDSDDTADSVMTPETLRRVPHWIGVLPYEACRMVERPQPENVDRRAPPWIQKPQWSRYPAIIKICHQTGRVYVIGDDCARMKVLSDACNMIATKNVWPLEPPAFSVGCAERDPQHLERIERARALILDGDLYQVNMARRLEIELRVGTPLSVYRHMWHASPSAYGAVLELDGGVHALSTSPELLVHASKITTEDGVQNTQIVCEPVKGTRPRGHDSKEDRMQREALDADPKERAELAMIVDVVRNDIGRICRVGSIHLTPPVVRTHRSLHHRVARIHGRLRSGVTVKELLKALVPSGSVTGAPKIRAMEVIRALEGNRRGLYTGGFGYGARDGSLKLAMAIRTLVLRGQQGHYWTGGGIVVASDPERELAETRWKAQQLIG